MAGRRLGALGHEGTQHGHTDTRTPTNTGKEGPGRDRAGPAVASRRVALTPDSSLTSLHLAAGTGGRSSSGPQVVEGQQVARKGRVDAARGGGEGEGCRRRREELPAVCGHYSLFNNTSVSISDSASVYLASWPSPAHLHTYTRRTGCPWASRTISRPHAARYGRSLTPPEGVHADARKTHTRATRPRRHTPATQTCGASDGQFFPLPHVRAPQEAASCPPLTGTRTEPHAPLEFGVTRAPAASREAWQPWAGHRGLGMWRNRDDPHEGRRGDENATGEGI
ncbi:hypothetical protein E2C01_058721 [Portunus trituberculatus]|uniref:Uncharacterized protein n=1 Tax=Portunus trituberculatus TaxID=210409 RepID=A0A5B7H0L0_PORTR|nr:hypothetical protein [Portunus trituberculatus]